MVISPFATAGVLVCLILALGPASGAHFNPAVTLAERVFGGLDTSTAVAYIGAQVAGGVVGVVTANVMFDLPLVEWSTKDRSAGHLVVAEVVATLGLLLVIFGVVRSGRATAAPYAVGAYIGGAYYFTSSTSFANPAVTVARTLGMSERTLRRRLAADGLGVQALVDEVRFESAKAYLAQPSLSIAEIALLLAFSDARAFTRAFKRWSGGTVSEYRRDQSSK